MAKIYKKLKKRIVQGNDHFTFTPDPKKKMKNKKNDPLFRLVRLGTTGLFGVILICLADSVGAFVYNKNNGDWNRVQQK